MGTKLRCRVPFGKIAAGRGGGVVARGEDGNFVHEGDVEIEHLTLLSGGDEPAIEAKLVSVRNPSPDGIMILSDLDQLAIRAEHSVILHLCPDCVIDLRGNSPGINVIEAEEGICILGHVLTDDGVSIADLTEPDAFVFVDSLEALECERSLSGAMPPIESHPNAALLLSVENPSSRDRGIEYVVAIPHPGGDVRVDLLDSAGRRLCDVYRGHLGAGVHSVTWNGAGSANVSAGVYFLRVTAAGRDEIRKLVILR